MEHDKEFLDISKGMVSNGKKIKRLFNLNLYISIRKTAQ